MAYTKDSSVNELAKVEGILDAIKDITGTKVDAGMLAMGGGMSCSAAAAFVGWTPEQIDKIVEFANNATK